jgi:hypothetical protein
MLTIVIQPVAISVKKKNHKKYGFTMHCYFDEYLFKTWTNVFKDIQECSHYASGFLMEQFIAPGSVQTVIENYHLVTGSEENQNISLTGIPYSIHYKPKEKYKINDQNS